MKKSEKAILLKYFIRSIVLKLMCNTGAMSSDLKRVFFELCACTNFGKRDMVHSFLKLNGVTRISNRSNISAR